MNGTVSIRQVCRDVTMNWVIAKPHFTYNHPPQWNVRAHVNAVLVVRVRCGVQSSVHLPIFLRRRCFSSCCG